MKILQLSDSAYTSSHLSLHPVKSGEGSYYRRHEEYNLYNNLIDRVWVDNFSITSLQTHQVHTSLHNRVSRL